MLAGVDENIHAGVGRGELRAVERSGEHRCGHEVFEFVAVDSVADDDHLQITSASQHRQPLDMLLRRQSADEPDDRLAVRRPPSA